MDLSQIIIPFQNIHLSDFKYGGYNQFYNLLKEGPVGPRKFISDLAKFLDATIENEDKTDDNEAFVICLKNDGCYANIMYDEEEDVNYFVFYVSFSTEKPEKPE